MTWSSGTFGRTGGSTAWGDDRDAGTEIEAGLHDTHDEDLAQGINDCLHKGGQNAATADISMGSNKLTNLAAPTAANDAATKAYADASGPFGGAVAGDQVLARLASTPSGWIKPGYTNYAIRLAQTPGSDGGTLGFTTAFSTAVATTTAGSHTHTVTLSPSAGAGSTTNVTTGMSTDPGHAHTSNVNVLYHDVSIFQKS